MKFRKSIESDINGILDIIRQAQDFFKEQGIDQWQNGYPNYDTIKNDIDNNESYVIEENDSILATSMITFKEELAYNSIREGKWLSNGEYATIHRIAVNNNYKGHGLATKVITYIEDLCLDKNIQSVRVDTHEKNIPMQNLLRKNGFEYCGVVSVSDGNRVAFEKCNYR